MFDQQQMRTYRELRLNGWKPVHAARFVKNSTKLATAEFEDLITFSWEYDDDYNAYDMGDTSTPEMAAFVEEEAKNLANGTWEALGCIAKANVNAVCRTCKRPTEQAEASLWGIVVDTGNTGRLYRRDVEIDLAMELGII